VHGIKEENEIESPRRRRTRGGSWVSFRRFCRQNIVMSIFSEYCCEMSSIGLYYCVRYRQKTTNYAGFAYVCRSGAECPARRCGLDCTAEYGTEQAQISDEICTDCAMRGGRWDVCRRKKYEKQLKK